MSLQHELDRIIRQLDAEAGTLHLVGVDGQLHLAAHSGIPGIVLDRVRTVPVGKGMAGLAAERRQPVTICNIQTDTSGDVRPGAKLTGMEGAIAVPMIAADGALGGVLGVANRAARTFTPEEEQTLLALGRQLLSATLP